MKACSSCHAELSLATHAAGYTCESLLYDTGLKDLSLSSTLSYAEQYEILESSLPAWMRAVAVKWILGKSTFREADT